MSQKCQKKTTSLNARNSAVLTLVHFSETLIETVQLMEETLIKTKDYEVIETALYLKVRLGRYVI